MAIDRAMGAILFCDQSGWRSFIKAVAFTMDSSIKAFNGTVVPSLALASVHL